MKTKDRIKAIQILEEMKASLDSDLHKGKIEKLTGRDIFNKYVPLDRDLFTDKEREYSQTLMTIFSNIGEEIYPLLERAEAENKKLNIDESNLPELWDSFEVSDVILV